jgi:thiol-disulfide isomerase/thioredoxin
MEGLNYKNILITVITIVVAGGLFLYITNQPQATNNNEQSQVMVEDDAIMDGGKMTDDSAMADDDHTTGEDQAMEGDTMMADNNTPDDSKMIDGGTMMADIVYSGSAFSDGISKVIDFNQADYDLALKANKTILLYFYANWCPLCAEEVPHFYQAFSELNNSAVVGFRVNYNDNNTDSNEKNLARQFGVAYQHTKVIVRGDKRLLKSPTTWDKNQYISEINNIFK